MRPIGRNFEVYIDLDPCNKTLVVGIEQYRTKVNLLAYTFGKTIHLYCNYYTKIKIILSRFSQRMMALLEK